MSATKLAELNSRRSYSKGSITRLKNTIASFEHLSLELLSTKRNRLVEAFGEYSSLCASISVLEPKDDDCEKLGLVEDDYLLTLSELDKHIASKSKKGPEEKVPVSNHAKTKLPSVVIPKFSGQYSEYHNFINLFTAMIHKDNTLYPVQKLYYLKGFLSEEPHSLVSNLPLEDDSYEKALELLKDRYDNKAKIIQEHIYTILDLPHITKSTTANLRKLISDTKQHLAALKNLDEPVDSWDSMVVCVLLRKLDMLTVRGFQLDRTDSKKPPTTQELLEYLEHRALALESTEASMHKPQPKEQRLTCHTATVTPHASCLHCNPIAVTGW
ncbi:hypothetical protein NE865_08003 [Phthorimaea operculella]|nr:hypothetical protein NE865_08003 [Phthorimaea operculella]